MKAYIFVDFRKHGFQVNFCSVGLNCVELLILKLSFLFLVNSAHICLVESLETRFVLIQKLIRIHCLGNRAFTLNPGAWELST